MNEDQEPDVTETATVGPTEHHPVRSAGPLPLVEVPIEYYVLEGEQGRGGIGIVMRARDLRTNRVVALKQLQSLSPEARLRFEREMLITARLQHPGVVPVHETGRFASGEPFYAMKLVQGRSLKELIAEKRTLAERLALLPHVLAMAETIAYAHNQGVIHRDLKPSNTIVGEYGETVVIDWGLAKGLDDRSDSIQVGGPYRVQSDGELTAQGQVLGTPAYMAPEQARGEDVDETGDVYSLGAILYHLLAGESPYRGSTSAEVLQAVSAGSLLPVDAREPRVPSDLAAIVQKSMHRNRSLRYADAKGLAEDLKRYQTGQLVGAHRYTSSELLLRWARSHGAAIVVAAASMLILAGFAFVFVRRNIEAREDAERQRKQAERQRDIAQETRDQSILAQASQSLSHDPTAALAWAKTYAPDGKHRAEIVAIAREAYALGTSLYVEEEPSGLILGVAFLGKTHRAVVLARDSADLWDADQGKVLARKPRRFSDGPVATARDKPYGLYVSEEHVLVFVDGESTATFLDLPTASAVRSYSISADGTVVAYRLEDGSLWASSTDHRPLKPTLVHQLPVDHRPNEYARIRVSYHGEYVFVARGTGTLEAIDVRSGATVAKASIGLAIATLQAEDEDGWLALQTTNGEVYFTRMIGAAFEPPRLVSKEGYVVPGGVLVPVKDGGIDAKRPDGSLLGHVGLDLRSATSFSATPSLSNVVAALASGEVDVWSANDPRTTRLMGHTAQVEALDISQDGQVVVSTSRDGKIRVWRIDRPGVRTLIRHDAQVYTLVPLGGLVVSTGCDAKLRISDLATGKSLVIAAGTFGCPIAQAMADGKQVLISTEDGDLLRLDVATRVVNKMGSAQMPYDASGVLATSTDGRWIAADFERSLQVGVWEGDRLVALVPVGKRVTSMVFQPVTNELFLATSDGTIYHVDLGDFTAWPLRSPGIQARRLLAYGKDLIIGTNDGRLVLMDPKQPESPPRELASHPSRVDSMLLQDDNLVAAHRDGYLTTLSLSHAGKSDSFRVCREAMGNLHARPGLPLFVLCRDGILKFVNVSTREARVLKTANDAIVVSSLGDTAILGDMDGRITLWKIPTFEDLRESSGREPDSMTHVTVDQL